MVASPGGLESRMPHPCPRCRAMGQRIHNDHAEPKTTYDTAQTTTVRRSTIMACDELSWRQYPDRRARWKPLTRGAWATCEACHDARFSQSQPGGTRTAMPRESVGQTGQIAQRAAAATRRTHVS